MKKYRTIVKKEKEAVRIVCDWCGKGSRKGGFFAGGSGSVSFGYGSRKHDGDTYSFDICDGCFDRAFDKVKGIKRQESGLSPEAVEKIKNARKRIKSGNFVTEAEAKKRLDV